MAFDRFPRPLGTLTTGDELWRTIEIRDQLLVGIASENFDSQIGSVQRRHRTAVRLSGQVSELFQGQAAHLLYHVDQVDRLWNAFIIEQKVSDVVNTVDQAGLLPSQVVGQRGTPIGER